MSSAFDADAGARMPVLNPVDRVTEMLFGLFMALTFVGAVAAGSDGQEEIRTMLYAALGCNLAWGMVDGVMYLVGTLADRGRSLTLARSVQMADAETGRRALQDALPQPLAGLVSAAEIEAIRGRVIALGGLPARPRLHRDDFLAALAIFLIVTAATFPVALPFMLAEDVASAMLWTRVIALAMLFTGGLALGRYAGYGSWKTGALMAGLGMAIVAALIALGG
jgi:VIT1/CCC1 family predicted Fe2+/Mn2+ transporter